MPQHTLQPPRRPKGRYVKVRATKIGRPAAASRKETKLAITVAPVARSRTTRSSGPRMNGTTSGGSLRIKNSELIADVAGTVAFNAVKMAIQPALAASFPWLSTLAKNYELYKFVKLVYRYVSRTSTDEKGSVTLAPVYDPTDTPPTDAKEMSGLIGAQEKAPWTGNSIHLDPKSLNRNGGYLFTRSTARPDDLAKYDGGALICATEGQTLASDKMGALWCDYEVELKKPQFTPVAPIPSRITTSRNVLGNIILAAVATQYSWNPIWTTLLSSPYYETSQSNGNPLRLDAKVDGATGLTYVVLPPGAYYLKSNIYYTNVAAVPAVDNVISGVYAVRLDSLGDGAATALVDGGQSQISGSGPYEAEFLHEGMVCFEEATRLYNWFARGGTDVLTIQARSMYTIQVV